MEERFPEGWFVRSEVDHRGDVEIKVLKCVQAPNEWAGTSPKLEVDLTLRVPYEIPWWQFWQPAFDARLHEAHEAAKKRAWTLNERVLLAGQLTYKLGHRN